MDEDFAERMNAALKAGNEFGARLIGLSQADAEALAADHPQLDVQFVQEGQPIPADLRSNRVHAYTRDGIVVDASAG